MKHKRVHILRICEHYHSKISYYVPLNEYTNLYHVSILVSINLYPKTLYAVDVTFAF